MRSQNPWRDARGRVLALASAKKEWYSIKNAATPDARSQVHIYDEIGFMGKTAHDFIQDLSGIEGPIDLHLNSPGGEVFDGVAIYNTLLAREDVDVYVDGIAASIASVIAMAGDRVFIAPTAQFMVHNAFAMACGDASSLREMADQLDRNTANIASIYAARTGQTTDHWIQMMDKESWFTGQEAVDAGLADQVVPTKTALAKFDFAMPPKVNKMAASLPPNAGGSHVTANPFADGIAPAPQKGQPKDAARHPYHGHFDIFHEPMTGTHSHNHAEFGHGDGDDGIHDHPHTHSNDATHGHQHMSHSHSHGYGDQHHQHAHAEGHDHYSDADHAHTHHVVDPDHDGDNDASAKGDTDHDYVLPNGEPGPKAMICRLGHHLLADGRHSDDVIFAKDKYTQADRDRMAKSGEAMPDGSYPIADGEDLTKAIHAVGRGKNNSHDAIRKHIIKRAKALGKSSEIPEDWSDGGSSSGSSDLVTTQLFNEADASAFISALRG